MRGNKQLLIFIMFLVVLCFAGCGSNIPELDEEQSKMISLYMADLLLSYDANYQSAILDEQAKTAAIEQEKQNAIEAAKQEEEQEQKEEQEEAERQPDDIEVVGEGNDTSNTISDIASFMGLEGAQIEFVNYEICTQYPQDNGETVYFSMTPTAGNDLLILKFNLANISGQSQTFDLFHLPVGYRVSINGETSKSVLTTLLEDDLSTFSGIVEMEQGIELVLVTEIPKQSEVSSLVLTVKDKETKEQAKMTLK